MLKSLRKLVGSKTVTEGEARPVAVGADAVQYTCLVERIVAGDLAAETELWTRFKKGVFQIVLNKVNDFHLAEDLTQETYLIIIEKIRKGDVRQPEKLGAFVAQVARFHAIEQIRTLKRRRLEDLGAAEQLPDPTPNQLRQLEKAEEHNEIRLFIGKLIARDRELLMRFYINEEPKERLCADLSLTSAQFDRVLHRARGRYRALYFKHHKRAQPDGRR